MATTKRALINGLVDGDDLPAEDVNLISNTLEVTVTDMGRSATGHIRLSVNPNDADTVTVNVAGTPKIYEFDNNASVTGDNIAVTIGGSAAATATNLRAAINTNQGTVLASAVHGTNTSTVDVAVINQGDALTLTESTAGARVVVQDNAEEAAEAALFYYVLSHTATAEDVTRGRVRIDTRMTSILNYIWHLTGGAWGGTISESAGVLEFVNNGVRDYVAGNVITVQAFGR